KSRGLELVQAGGVSDLGMDPPADGAMGAKAARGCSDLLVVRDDRASVAEGTKVLARIEAEACSVAQGAGAPAVHAGASGLRRVRHEPEEAPRGGKLAQLTHRRGIAEQVYGEDRASALPDRRFGGLG